MPKVNSKDKTAATVDFGHLSGLPEPVQRYFKHVLKDGQSVINQIKMTQHGSLRTSTDSNKWISFKATQLVSPNSKSFIWHASIKLFPAVYISVADSLQNGRGSGKVKLFNIFPVASDSNHKKLNSGALHRYLAEAVWFPTALLPAAGIRWTAIDDKRALATLTQHELTVELEFRFNEKNEVESVYSEGRYGQFNGEYRKQPWEGHFKDYHEVNGIKVPRYGEVGWWQDGKFDLVWRGEITKMNISYEDKK